ncbi:4-hydroxy-3-methylbut-2-enyl diphosphate reductase [bacterium MnTg02]|nr:4-hydroxy-3-methylbut-2-enyl diphosphate reductase [bacterium MnTg02]
MSKPSLKILLCEPRGFCAGVDRAIQIVEFALKKYGAPVYVRHEIVHNRHVVEDLEAKGTIFVNELDEIPDSHAPVIFSAHGVPKSIPEQAKRRNLFFLDATCPLVSKVHIEAQRNHEAGLEILLIGHADHPEVIGTIGQLPDGAVKLIETAEDAGNFKPKSPDKIAYVTQTTLSVDDTREIVDILKRRFPAIIGPHKSDICYATTNRQSAVRKIASDCNGFLVVGSPNSSNSNRLVEVARRAGCTKAFLVQDAKDIPWHELKDVTTLGLTAGASAPESLVQDIIEAFSDRYETSVDVVATAKENIAFKVPRELQDVAAE